MNGYAVGTVETHKIRHLLNRECEVREGLPGNYDWFVTPEMRPFITHTHQMGCSGKI